MNNEFVNVRILDNFYQTSSFFPMPVVLVSTVAEMHNPGHADHRFRWMPSTRSRACRPPVPAHGVHFFRDIGIGGRHDSESVDGMLRNPDG